MSWLQTAHGKLLAVGIFCFLLGIAAGTGGSNFVLGLVAIALLTAGAITVTWGSILALRHRVRTRPADGPGTE